MDFIIIIATVSILVVVLVPMLLIPRIRMERRARDLLAQYPGAERTSVYLELHSGFADGKKREIDAKIAEMQPQGWIFLKAREANPLRTMSTWGGGLTLHFIRLKV